MSVSRVPEAPLPPLPIIGSYDKQRFTQFSPENCANWSMTNAPSGKKQMALYPTMGRRHLRFLEQNRLIFADTPRGLFRTANYWYSVVNDNIYRIDKNFNQVQISGVSVATLSGNVFCCYIVAVTITYVVFVDGQKIYIYREPREEPIGTIIPGQFFTVTDPNAPKNPTYVATFGNRIVVSNLNSSQFNLSKIFLGGNVLDPSTCFSDSLGAAVFAQATGIIKQFGVLNNTLYIFTDFKTNIWSDIPSSLVPAFGETAVTFPWKASSAYDWDFGIADSLSLDSDFNMMTWLAQNQNGLVQVMISRGGLPKKISTKAISVLFQKNANTGAVSPFLAGDSDGFLYQYEDTIFYRLSAGRYMDFGILDQTDSANSIEYNFDTETWTRCIELNGERCRIQKHIFFDTRHFVTVEDDTTVYEMSGQFYDNEITNPAQSDSQAVDAYLRLPFRYERTTQIIAEDDYSEFITDYVQIDFVWGDHTFINSNTPFANAVFIIDEEPDGDGNPVFMVTEENSETFIIAEGSNTPDADSPNYNKFFKPHIELYFSDDGGINFLPADVREFSQLGIYSWRMRWYQLGASRNRCYKLVCVSPAPIVILGGSMSIRRVSGGAN